MVRDDRVVLKLNVGGQAVGFASFTVDAGVTPEQRAYIEDLRARAAVPAESVVADADGCRLVWSDGWPLVFTPPAWKGWWGDRPSVQDLEACDAFTEFERYLYGDNVIGGKVDSAITSGELSLWDALRDFPETILHSTSIQKRIHAEYAAGGEVRRHRGKRTRADRQATLDRWMTTVSRVGEHRQKGSTLAGAFAAVARLERRAGRSPDAQIRGEYERGRRWQRLFSAG